jgi:hypothetical protein
MSHIIGKVYEVNKENMNKLIAELDMTREKLRLTVNELLDLKRKSEKAINALESVTNTEIGTDFTVVDSLVLQKALNTLSGIK